MRNTPKMNEIRTIPLFSACTADELMRAARTLERVEVWPGTVLLEEGRTPSQFVAIAQGSALVTFGEQLDGVLGTGAHAGDVELLLRSRMRRTVTAATPMTVYVCDPRRFSALIDAIPNVARKLLVSLAERTRYASASARNEAAISDV